MPADHFENRKLRLSLLRHCMHIAEAPLERIVFEDRGGASRQISRLGDLPRLLAKMNGSHAQPDALR